MKIKHFTLFAIILIISSCSSVSYLSATSKSDKKAVKTFLKEIKEVVTNKHYTVLLNYMDADYLKEQHHDFLNGDDLKFINEIFCGKDITDDSFHCIKQANVIYFETKEITQVEDLVYKALFIIGDQKNKVACQLLISKKVVDGKTKFGIVGAVG
jgi:Tfp pilus assembly protein PilE